MILAPNLLQDACDHVDGIPHRKFSSKPVCCNKNCPRCGGNKCGKSTDANGKRLGAGQCCGVNILKRGQVCETPTDQTPEERNANVINAPCMYAGKGVDILEDLKDAGFFDGTMPYYE